MNINYGFLEPTITDDNYILGGLGVPKKVLNPDRDWTSDIPQGEIQRRNIETSSCTEYGTLNAIETLEKKLFGIAQDYSERFVAIGAGNTEIGNDPHTVAEWIRHNGLIEESLLPFTDQIQSWAEYVLPNPLPTKLTNRASKWLKTHYFKHEWVFKGGNIKDKQNNLLEALLYSPIGVSVAAWHEDSGIYVKADNEPDNHWCLLIAGKPGEPWKIYDSYINDGKYIKLLDWNYNFGYAKLFILNQLRPTNFLDFIKQYFAEIFS